MIADVFIKRPRFAIVVSLIITIAGALAYFSLPVEQFPNITPPQVAVSATYPGANAEVIESSVAQQIEAGVNGVEDMLYMSSTSSDDGSYSLTVTFKVGTDPDTATMNVQNRVKQIEAKLPEDVIKQGVSVRQKNTSMLQIFQFVADTDQYDLTTLTNYVLINIKDELSRVSGVGDIMVFSHYDYSMRIWVNDDKLKSLKLSTSDIVQAVRSQNIQASVGRIGSMPAPKNQVFQITLTAQGRLTSAEEFGNIIIRANKDGSYLRLKDVAEVKLGAQSEEWSSSYNGHVAVGMAINQAAGSNAIEVASGISKKLEELKPRIPEGISIEMMFDNAAFVKRSMGEIEETIIIGFILVVAVIYLFMGSIKTTIIPLCAIPVSLIGAFAGMMIFGVTINTVSMLALVLAIGVVVDDAIVVVEDVEAVMQKHPKDKASLNVKRSMDRITNPIIATTLILLGVFIPVAFIPGITGLLYRQFAVAVCCAVVISAINALTLSPALARLLMKPNAEHNRFVQKAMGFVDVLRDGYVKLLKPLVKVPYIVIPALIAVGIGTLCLFRITPTGFLPSEDQGAFLGMVQLPSGASFHRTHAVLKQVEELARQIEGVKGVMTVTGFGMQTGAGSNNGFVVVNLIPYEERQASSFWEKLACRFDESKTCRQEDLTVTHVIRKFNQVMGANIKDAIVQAFNVPALMGASSMDGFEYVLQSTEGVSPEELVDMANKILIEAGTRPELTNVMTYYRVDGKRLAVDVNREKAYALGVSVSEIFNTMQAILGGVYINDFNLYGRSWQVRLQGVEQDRSTVEDIYKIELKNNKGDMVPLRSLITIKETVGASSINRYNNYRSLTITGQSAPGYSSGDAIKAMAEVSEKVLEPGFKYEWTGTSAQEVEAGGQTIIVFAMSFLFGYLF